MLNQIYKRWIRSADSKNVLVHRWVQLVDQMSDFQKAEYLYAVKNKQLINSSLIPLSNKKTYLNLVTVKKQKDQTPTPKVPKSSEKNYQVSKSPEKF